MLRTSGTAVGGRAEGVAKSPVDAAVSKAAMPFADAGPILEAFRAGLPGNLQDRTPSELQAAWPGWVARHDREIRARLARGDEDSIVNFWLYGTTFTRLPRVTERDLRKIGGGPANAQALLLGRLDDLVKGLAAPGANERLHFARQVVERHGIDLATAAGQDQARAWLVQIRERVLEENARFERLPRGETRRGSARDAGAFRHGVSRARPVIGHENHRRLRPRSGARGAGGHAQPRKRYGSADRDCRSRPRLRGQGAGI